MQFYLPVAELNVDILLLMAIGGSVGLISGIFGVGGGFLLAPLLIFFGVPSDVAIASLAAQVAATSLTGALAYHNRSAVDYRMGAVMIGGGLFGSVVGVFLFNLLRDLGFIDVAISISYLVLLGSLGLLMCYESISGFLSRNSNSSQWTTKKPGSHAWIFHMPFKLRFKRAKLYISAIPIVILGFLIGIMGALLGVGGGFILVPAMIYILHTPTAIAIGTTMFYIAATMSISVLLHSVTSFTVDIFLAIFLTLGGVLGAHFGARIGQNLSGSHLRGLMGLLLLLVALRFANFLFVPGDEIFSISTLSINPGSNS